MYLFYCILNSRYVFKRDLSVVDEADFERALTRDLGEDFCAARPRPVRLVVRLVVVMLPADSMFHTITLVSCIIIQGDTSVWLKPSVDLDLGSSGSWWAPSVATNCPDKMVKLSQVLTRFVTLYGLTKSKRDQVNPWKRRRPPCSISVAIRGCRSSR